MTLRDGDLILFQGDSITDAGRDRNDPAGLGTGYPAVVAARLAAERPTCDVRVLNRGISGNRARDLEARWEEDCIRLRPTVVSLLIGINDTWRRFDSNDPTTADEYERSYRHILERTRTELEARIVVCEPFLLSVSHERDSYRIDLDPKIQVARRLAREYAAAFVPLDGLFAAASVHRASDTWAQDGVHPSAAGHALIAEAWLRAVSTE